jgi:predicted dehydrogenase
MQTAVFLPQRPAGMAEERPLRVAVIGAGVMGRRHARVLASRPERFELVGVMDVNARTARDVAEACGAPVSPREVDAIALADALVVATPAGAHAQSVRCALACGRHVLVEKPIASSTREAADLVALAKSSGAHLFVGHSERFNPVIRALARLVEPSVIRAIELRRIGSRSEPQGPSRGSGEGALVNLGVHDLDIAAYLTRSLLVPTSAVGKVADGGVEERAQVLARTASGAAVHVLVDQRPADGARRRTIAVSTPSHVWHGDLLAPSLARVCRVTAAREAIPLDTEEPLLAQALAFAAAIRAGAPREIASGLDGQRALVAAAHATRLLRGADPGSRGENLAPRARI